MQQIGIPKAGLIFLKKLAKNNNRDWFLANKHLYEEELKLPLQNIISELGQLLAKKAKGIVFDPKKSIFRVNRDTRFSNNKNPYKTHIAASFTPRTQRNQEEAPGLYIHIEPGNCFIGGGLYMPSSEQLRKIRELINKDPKLFKKIISGPIAMKHFSGLTGDRLKRAPRGIAEDHPNIELLKWKQFTFIKRYSDLEVQTSDFTKKIQKEFESMLPLIDWLNKAMILW